MTLSPVFEAKHDLRARYSGRQLQLRRFTFTVDYARNRVDFMPNALLDGYVPYRSTGL
ncbi:MAG TPA: hypothetical protein VMF61_04060 [Candidatus Acidoferrales bacterium]|nr:hypothetical protein [Candidatus Acidoferrales bacterium]